MHLEQTSVFCICIFCLNQKMILFHMLLSVGSTTDMCFCTQTIKGYYG